MVDTQTLATSEQFEKALVCYRRCKWEAAESLLVSLLDAHPDDALYSLYLDPMSYYCEPRARQGRYLHLYVKVANKKGRRSALFVTPSDHLILVF